MILEDFLWEKIGNYNEMVELLYKLISGGDKIENCFKSEIEDGDLKYLSENRAYLAATAAKVLRDFSTMDIMIIKILSMTHGVRTDTDFNERNLKDFFWGKREEL